MVAGFGRSVYLSFLIPLWHLVLRSESDHFRSGRSSTWISSHSGSSQSRWSASRLNLAVTNGRIFFTRVVVVCVCSTLQILGVGLVIFQVLLFFLREKDLMGEVFRNICETYDLETLQKRILHQGEAEHNWNAAPPERFVRISTLRGSDAPAPASSPPPAAPANSVNISDGLAPAREAGAKNDGRGGSLALFLGWWVFLWIFSRFVWWKSGTASLKPRENMWEFHGSFFLRSSKYLIPFTYIGLTHVFAVISIYLRVFTCIYRLSKRDSSMSAVASSVKTLQARPCCHKLSWTDPRCESMPFKTGATWSFQTSYL